MPKELAIIVTHGMGSQDTSFADPMVNELNSRIGILNKDPNKIAWGRIYWQDIVEPEQLRYFRAARNQGDLDYIRLRKFVLTAFGDAAAYKKSPRGSSNTTYKQIHGRIKNEIRRLYQNDLGSQSVPLIVMAHSLGGHIVSNYIWDTQNAAAGTVSSLDPFEKMESLAGMITFGCNIPIFTFAHSPVVPITFPAPQLPNPTKAKARWFNFYDPDDVLGYPLKPINQAYRAVVNRDIPINAGSIFSSWNPLSHGGYWTDNDFTKPVSRFIARFL